MKFQREATALVENARERRFTSPRGSAMSKILTAGAGPSSKCRTPNGRLRFDIFHCCSLRVYAALLAKYTPVAIYIDVLKR